MDKNLKLTYILLCVFAAITMAFKTLTVFFGGVGINFVVLLAIAFSIMLIALKKRDIAKNCWDMYILAGVLLVLECVVYFACEFGDGLYFEEIWIYQNVIAFIGILVLAYVGFRFTLDFLGKKVKFVEVLLGREKIQKKPKRAKEITNGSLLEKPNHQESNTEEKKNEEPNQPETPSKEKSQEEIIVETEE